MLDILELRDRGLSVRAISRVTGLSRKTVKKYLQEPRVPSYSPRPKRQSILEPFKRYIQTRMAEGVMNARRLLREIRELGYPGSITILRDFMKPLRSPVQPRAVVRFETKPGEQAQVDFGVFSYQDGKITRRVYAFVMVLSYSRAMYVEFVKRQDLGTLLRCHVHAFEALGGIPEKVLYDNMKPVVQARTEGRVVWNSRFLDFALALGFTPQACRPYRAQTKGKVERAMRYLRQSLWPALRFSDLDDLNAQAKQWCQMVANQRVHGGTNRKPCDLLAEERLHPLPSKQLVAPYLAEERKVGRDGLVSYSGSRYGVPWQYAGRTVDVHENGNHVEIHCRGSRVAVHPKALLPGSIVPLAGQYAGLSLQQQVRVPALAIKVPSPEVEVRPLTIYDSVAEVADR